jgi:hypothetical protein
MKVIKNDYPGAVFKAIPVAEPGEPCQRCATPLEEMQGLFGILCCPSCESDLFLIAERLRQEDGE